jgi:hypothetical protein
VVNYSLAAAVAARAPGVGLSELMERWGLSSGSGGGGEGAVRMLSPDALVLGEELSAAGATCKVYKALLGGKVGRVVLTLACSSSLSFARARARAPCW